MYCKRTAIGVARAALLVHGANGRTKDLRVEELFRDTRVWLIEDGPTEVLVLEALTDAVQNCQIQGNPP